MTSTFRWLRNPWLQSIALGLLLFALSLVGRALADTVLGGVSAGPAAPDVGEGSARTSAQLSQAALLGVALPALVETPVVVWIVRRAKRDAFSIGLAAAIVIIFGAAWLLHGASPGSLGQAAAFAIIAYAAWAWGRVHGKSKAYALPTLAHAVWNAIIFCIFALNHP